jgi:hypothetical protein
MTRSGALALVGALAAVLAGCGVKAPPRPPVGATREAGAAPGAGDGAAPAKDCNPDTKDQGGSR